MSQISNAVSDLAKELALLPDDLYRATYNLQSRIDEIIRIMRDDLLDIVNRKGYKRKVDCNNTYSLLRRVLPRNEEFTERDSHIRTALSYICIFDDVIPKQFQPPA